MMRKAVYTGSFDPITNGHMDIIIQALSFVEDLVIAIGCNSVKTKGFLSIQERSELIKQSIFHFIPDSSNRVSVISFEGLAVNLAKDISAQVIVRGLRDMTDFDYEMRMTSVNRCLCPEIATIALFAKESSRYVTSTLIRHLISIDADITSFVPDPVCVFFKKHRHLSC
ncbi:pantetheine-phosphate adenylyltransferase [Candidatus Liberibacter asiaticus]|uniref:Phosphopantetheine adenylyltransferase n=1 Tax=Candidatus Liberibacter asiaticus str. gxpsy TaxID=1174529 RepID=A0ABN4AZB4_LIBAS|nr:pantetheine-phosphate adenylyltransferase [Candidatus Liberibacter asiaticus]AGH16421.1 phosphopantetheine adenylyltransferase [Candidatus Liberibacter asiaticus str. gxpsy]ALK07742.2 pantetheine-phosphate adenylyltransferase [Candidatus Liberibacter asiaticus]AWL13624.1 pantetheine-phosphate adenylyltransferase [Candidatus Liberibacter asiaticus]KAE9510597.1 Phosphopantetheine adenylyltransferase [Candidatus Liberibacter asiaticus]KAE9511709.1 Phosphopantetheine adenylyltransferase [Candid